MQIDKLIKKHNYKTIQECQIKEIRNKIKETKHDLTQNMFSNKRIKL